MIAPAHTEGPFDFDGSTFPSYIAALAAYREIMMKTVESLSARYDTESLRQKFGVDTISQLTDINAANLFTHTSISSLRGDDADTLAMMRHLLNTDPRIAEFKKKLLRLRKADFAEDILFFLEFRLKSIRAEVAEQTQNQLRPRANV